LTLRRTMRAVNPLRGLIELGWTEGDDAELRLRKSTLTVAAITISVLAFVWVGTYAALGLPVAAGIPAVYQVVTVVGLVWLARTHDFRMFRLMQLGLMAVLPFVLQWAIGGFINSSVVSLWSLIAALGGVFFYGARGSLPWFALFMVLTVVSAIVDPVAAAGAPPIPQEVRTAFFALNVSGVALTTFAIVHYFVRQREAALAQSDRLLLNILPEAIATRLKRREDVIAETYPEVAVLFADVVDFTPYVVRTAPADVIRFLNRLFTAFDRLADRHGLEKIKTIGDAYMVAGGVPEPLPNPAAAVAEMALEMLDEARLCTAEGMPVRLRIGIDCGPVVAGVIGRRKFAYDLWGDPVNTASRMESHGAPDRIHVTAAVEARLHGRYRFEPRGPIEVKGKGMVETYFLVGRRG
jgi:class 3 adenylate cyclase